MQQADGDKGSSQMQQGDHDSPDEQVRQQKAALAERKLSPDERRKLVALIYELYQ